MLTDSRLNYWSCDQGSPPGIYRRKHSTTTCSYDHFSLYREYFFSFLWHISPALATIHRRSDCRHHSAGNLSINRVFRKTKGSQVEVARRYPAGGTLEFRVSAGLNSPSCWKNTCHVKAIMRALRAGRHRETANVSLYHIGHLLPKDRQAERRVWNATGRVEKFHHGF